MNTEKNESGEVRRWVFRILLFIYDGFVVNFAFFMAIIIRFYIEYRFYDRGAEYMHLFWQFTPWYTGAALIVFILFRLYSGVWRYVGVNDIKRLILANICTCILQVAGSLVIIERMPLTYYGIGAFLQLILMSIPRIAPRLILESFGSSGGSVSQDVVMPLMIIGIGENARIIQRKVMKDRESVVRPTCVLDYGSSHTGSSFNGLPVVSGDEGVKTAIEKYGVKCAIIADDDIPDVTMEHIRKLCEKNDIELQNFTMKVEAHGTGLRLKELLAMAQGPVKIVEAAETGSPAGTIYPTGQEALEHYRYNYMVEGVSSDDGTLTITVRQIRMASVSPDDEWVKRYKEENGGEVSFFV